MNYSIEELQRISTDGYVDVQCPECQEYSRIEPDADEETCPYCRQATLTSPLVELGLI